MGSCLSKKSTCSSCPTAIPSKPNQNPNPNPKPKPPQNQIKPETQVLNKRTEEETVKKEIFIIKHRKSHDIDRKVSEEEKEDVIKTPEIVVESGKIAANNTENAALNGGMIVTAPVRTSSCTKEEVDAILIQCGRLSRSSSTGKANLSGSCGSGEKNNTGNNPPSSQRARKYSGSKRSYDFDNEIGSDGRDGDGRNEDKIGAPAAAADDNGEVGERSHRHRQRQRQSRTVGSPSKGRRRTPSREREQQGQQQRSGSSRERGNSSSSGNGRRVSRSPGRRSESPITTTTTSSGNGNKPGKMVSVPATVSSLVMDKSNNAGGGNESISGAAVKRIQVKRNVGGGGGGDAAGARTAASPRARSPARGNVKVFNENQNLNQQQPGSLSRSNSRKAEHSPYRRNPLSEIDTNVVIEQATLPGVKAGNNIVQQAPIQKPSSDYMMNKVVVEQGAENKISSSKGIAENRLTNLNVKTNEQQHVITSNAAVNMIPSGTDCLKPQAITRSRSSRLSRDFDINHETLSNPPPSYTALLLEDIQNFHQKSTTTTPAISLPPCLSKACSILEAVADLNSSTSSNLSSAFSEDKRRIPTVEQFNKLYDNVSSGANKVPFVQSEVVVGDDITEPTFHKYVTVSRGGGNVVDMEQQESSGSNSFVGGQQCWISPSSWEPNSADSTDCWTSSRSNNVREDSVSPLGFQRQAMSESGHDAEEATRRLSGKKRDSDQQQNGIGRGRIGSKGLLSVPTVTAAST